MNLRRSAALVGALAVAALAVPPAAGSLNEPARPTARPVGEAREPSRPASDPHRPEPSVPVGTWASWATLQIGTGVLVVGGEPGTNTTESMIKVGLAADLLTRRRPTSVDYATAEAMIRDSDNDAAERSYRAGGRDAVLRRVVATCGLAETTTKPGWWSETRMTAADAARLGACVTRRPIVGPWIAARMREVRGEGRFGLGAIRPELGMKNGWTFRDDGLWHVNCLTVGPDWTAAVLLRYDGSWPLAYGAALCSQITEAIIPPP